MITVIYHSADMDGICCREIAKMALGHSATYIGWNYGDPVPEIAPDVDRLYMLDISIDELMDHPKLVWIDHHKSAIEKYGRREGLQIDGVAACRLAWQYFWCAQDTRSVDPRQPYLERKVHEPTAVTLIGEYDVWDKRDPRAELLQHGLRSVDLNDVPTGLCPAHSFWGLLFSFDQSSEEALSWLLNRGEAIRFYKESQDAKVMERQAFLLQFEGLKFIAANLSPGFNSSAFESVLLRFPDADAVMGYSHNGKEWTVSMYGIPGKPDVDLSVIATQMGGGGHKQACGFRTWWIPWVNGACKEDSYRIYAPKMVESISGCRSIIVPNKYLFTSLPFSPS